MKKIKGFTLIELVIVIAIIVILGAVGLPFEAVGIIIGIDRLLDMLRTSVNVYGDTCCVSVVAK